MKSKYKIILWVFILAYIIYFSYFTTLRFKTLYSSYYDLGIMNQTVYNTYQAIKLKDPGRILELTDIDSPDQIKRMSIHNDPLLALFAPFYFIYPGPETLLVIQTIVIALGTLAVYKISREVLKSEKNKDLISLIFSLAYLFYPPLQRANIFDFHAVTLSTTFLLFMFYFWLIKRYRLSFIFVLLSLFSKEQVGLTVAFFGIYSLIKRKNLYSILITSLSFFWFILSVSYIIPLFRGKHHFALTYYGDFGDSPSRVIIGILKNPLNIFKYLYRFDTLNYLFLLLGPLVFISLFSPIQLLIAAPEFGINLLSNSWNMRAIIYHYTAVITPFIFISAIYGGKKIMEVKNKKPLILLIVIFTIIFSYLKSPLPFSREAEIHPFKFPQQEANDVKYWSRTLKDDKLKISTTGQLAPFFTSRRYFYNFSARYNLADYVLVRLNEIYQYPEKDSLIPIYNRLKKDYNYKLIFKKEQLEVYKRVKS